MSVIMSSGTTFAPTIVAMSILCPPFNLLSVRVDNASPVISSAIINKGLLVSITGVNIATACSFVLSIPPTTNINGFCMLTSILSGEEEKKGVISPRSNCRPSTLFKTVSNPLPSSTLTAPSDPTLLNASATILPIAGSLLAEIVAICSTIGESCFIAIAVEFNSSTITCVALSIPLLRSNGL